MAKRPQNQRDKILNAALSLAADQPWNAVSLADIAEQAGVDLEKLHGEFPSRAAIVAAMMDRTTALVLRNYDPADRGEPPHDRLLDAMMCRLDALSGNREAMRSVIRGLLCDPGQSLCVLPSLAQAMAWTLEAAGIGSGGLRGALRVKGLAAIYLATLRVWISDDSEDLGKTMAFLDKRLRDGERVASLIPGLLQRNGVSDRQSDPDAGAA